MQESSRLREYDTQNQILLQDSKRLLDTVLSIQPGAARAAGTAGAASSDDRVAQLVNDVLASLPAVFLREDASVARDPFAQLPTGAVTAVPHIPFYA